LVALGKEIDADIEARLAAVEAEPLAQEVEAEQAEQEAIIDPQYITLIGDAYRAALAGAMPRVTLRLSPGRTIDDPNAWFLLAIKRACFLRRQFGEQWSSPQCRYANGDLLLTDIEAVLYWHRSLALS
jgi:hypothetical protein